MLNIFEGSGRVGSLGASCRVVPGPDFRPGASGNGPISWPYVTGKLAARLLLSSIAAPGTLSQGPIVGGEANSTATGGDGDWSSPEKAIVQNDDPAFISLTSDSPPSSSDYLFARNFGFSIPLGATIKGIKVEIRCAESFVTGTGVSDNLVNVAPTTSPAGTNLAGNTELPGSMVNVTYGSSTELWGQSWAPADVNASTFSVLFQAVSNGSGNGGQANVDNIQVTVYYTP